MGLKPGAICPIVGLAGKKSCLKSSCQWYRPVASTKCLVTELEIVLGKVVLANTKAADSIEKIVEWIEKLVDEDEHADEHADEHGVVADKQGVETACHSET